MIAGGILMRFQEPFRPEQALGELEKALEHSLAGDGSYTELCQDWLKTLLGCPDVLMTTSCTHALELALYVLNLEPGDEVIVPSFTYPSTANAVLLAGGHVVYCEVESNHLTLDPKRLEAHITKRTKAIVAVHYGGMCCDMDAVMSIAERRGLIVIEDGAQSFMSRLGNRHAGTFGHMGCLSFHGTKDVIAGEGGALLINAPQFLKAAQTFRLKGTNSLDFKAGRTSQYEWVSLGSSYSPSELTMAMLYSQLQQSDVILDCRRNLFAAYADFFLKKQFEEVESYSSQSELITHNGHLYYIILRDSEVAQKLKTHLMTLGIPTQTHFVPLHESAMGRQFIRQNNRFQNESGLGQRLIRLPLHPGITFQEQETVMEAIDQYFRRNA